MLKPLTSLTLILAISATSRAEREHKVHNIILYPEKYSWCTTTAIQQVVASPGYEPVTIDNNICVGACYSYSIPSTEPAEPGEQIGPYCDSCQPAETKCYHVTLKANEGAKTFQKRVQIIMNCSCMSCEKYKNRTDCEITDENTLELPSDLFSNRTQVESQKPKQDEIPDFLNFEPKRRLHLLDHGLNMNIQNASHEQKFELNSKLINLLKSIQNNSEEEGETSNINYDKNQLEELLKIIEGSESELSDKNLMEFVNFVNIHNSEDLEIDLSNLKEVLNQFQKDQKILNRHRDFGLGLGQKNNEAIEKDLKKYDLPANYGVEGTIPSKSVVMNEISSGTDENPAHHHHHLGEEIQVGLNLHHLVKGPHGSMVASPVEEKLNIDPDILKPNHDGVVIAYENHSNSKKSSN